MIGIVAWWDEGKGFGFIRRADTPDERYFVHKSAVADARPLRVGERVSFTATRDARRRGQLRAEDVRPAPVSQGELAALRRGRFGR